MSTKRILILAARCDGCGRTETDPDGQCEWQNFGPVDFCPDCCNNWPDTPCQGCGTDYGDPLWAGNCADCWEEAMTLPRGYCGATYQHGGNECTLPAGHSGGHHT